MRMASSSASRDHELEELLALVRTLLAERRKELRRLAAEVRMLRRLEKHVVKLLLEEWDDDNGKK